MSQNDEIEYERFRIVEGLLREIVANTAPAPEKAAKVSAFPVGNCVVCGELVAPYNKHAKYEGGYTCQPAPPEPAAPVNGSTPVGEYDPDMKPAAMEMPEAVRDKMREEALDAALNRNFRGQAGLLFVEGYCAAVRQQAAQGRKVELGKVRELIFMVRNLTPYLAQLGYADLSRSFNDYADAALAEIDAAEGKGEGRG